MGPLGPVRLTPHVDLPCHRSVGAIPKPITSLHSSRFDQEPRLSHGGLMGPLSYTWEPPPTYQPTSCPNLRMCCLHNRLGGATSTLGCKGGASKGRPASPGGHRPPCCLQIPSMPPYTINRGCGARWKMSHSVLVISKLSKLL